MAAAVESPRETPANSTFRNWVGWIVVAGTGLLSAFFFLYLGYHILWGPAEPKSWLAGLLSTHYAATVGTPLSAVTAFCIVTLLKVTSGPIEFEAIGFKFRGASGPIVLWVISFLAVASVFHLLWNDTPKMETEPPSVSAISTSVAGVGSV